MIKSHLIKIYIMLLIIILMISALTLLPGCSFSLGGSPQKKPYVSPKEVERNVKDEMKSPEIRSLIINTVKTQKLEEILNTPEADQLISEEVIQSFTSSSVNTRLQEEIKKALETSEVQKVLQEQMKKTIDTPEFQKALTQAVQKTLMQLVQGQGGGGQESGTTGGS